jgi:hypothetical protein
VVEFALCGSGGDALFDEGIEKIHARILADGHFSRAETLMAGKVLPGLYSGESGGGQQIPPGFALIPAVLEQQPAARFQMRRGGGGDGADAGEAIGSVGERRSGFVGERGQMRVVGGKTAKRVSVISPQIIH